LSVNLFTYANNNPISWTDALGLAGHHVVPGQVSRGSGVSDEARKVFDAAVTGWEEGVDPHGWSSEHLAYNDAVQSAFDKYLSDVGKSADQLTAKEAEEFVNKVLGSSDPAIRDFLNALSKLLGRECRAGAGAAASRVAKAIGAAAAAGGLDTLRSKCMNDPQYCPLWQGQD